MTSLIRIGNNIDTEDIHLIPNENLYNGSKSLSQKFGYLNSMEEDLLNLASGIYASDLAVKRKEREDFVRNIEINIEVVNYDAFERIREELIAALHILSSDNWKIKFIPKSGPPVSDITWYQSEGAVLLFSGGIDSMCGAVELIKNGKNIVLVSHITQGNSEVPKSQTEIHSLLENYYNIHLEHIQIKVYARNKGKLNFPSDNERENTQRTRSFLFLVLGVLAAWRFKFNKVLFMAENGQFAIHLPLNESRVGPFSTHTANPYFLNKIQNIFVTLLRNSEFKIINPFLYKTKPEVFSLLPNKLKKVSVNTISCWMYSRYSMHCGECIPCIARRIATEHNNIIFNQYKIDIFKSDLDKLSDDNTGKRNVIDYLEFIRRFKTTNKHTLHELKFEFPELFNPAIKIDNAIEMYRRLAKQSYDVLKNYPKVYKFLL